MKKQTVALINNIKYCKFPQGINNIKEFIELLNTNYTSFLEFEFFVEEGCVAPFFIEEDLKTETQYWNPHNIRQVKAGEISILRRYEYEERLKKVIQERCIHCERYIDDDCEDYSSFIEKIDLEGNCYEFETKKG